MPGPEAKTDSGTPPSKTGVEVGVEDSFGYGDGVVAAGSDAFYDDGNGDFRVVGGGEAGEPGVGIGFVLVEFGGTGFACGCVSKA